MPAPANQSNRKNTARRQVASMHTSKTNFTLDSGANNSAEVRGVQSQSRGARIFRFIGKQWSNFKESKAGRAFAVLTGSAFGRAVAIGIACLTIAGITGPAAPVIAITLGSLGLASVAIGAIVDTIQTRNIRKLKKENNLLVQNRSFKSAQDYILNLQPELQETLKEQLYNPERTANQKSIKERYINPQDRNQPVPKVLMDVALKHGVNIAAAVVSGVATGGVSAVQDGMNITKSAGQVLFSVAMETRNKLDIEGVSLLCKKQIDTERDKEDTPGYSNLKELKESTRQQRIQTMALKKLSAELYQQCPDGSYRKLSAEEIKSRFERIKSEIASKEKIIQHNNNIFTNTLKSWSKAATKAHDPFSQYNDPSKINIQKHGELTRSVEAIKKNLDESKYIPTKATATPLPKFVPSKLSRKSSNNITPPSASK